MMADFPVGTVTFFFADIEGSTRLLQVLGDRYVDLLNEYRSLFRSIIAKSGGREIDNQGDAFFVAFHRAGDALRAAVALELAMANQAWINGAAVRTRIGVHSGEAVLTPAGYVGLDVHRAARICSAASGGQIVLSQTTCRLVEHDLPSPVALRDLGEHRLKDLQRPERLFQVLHPDLPTDFPPLTTLRTLPNNLPVQLTSFIGREQEVAEVGQLLGASRLITLTGFGGSGKTRLALQVAADVLEQYPQGVWWVELADLRDPALIPQAIASALQVREEPGRAYLATLTEYLQDRHLLLVLDNCEHVIRACAEVTQILLRACPRLQILATSRETLDVSGEFVWRVRPLSLPRREDLPPADALIEYEAIKLFVERAVAARPSFAVTAENAPVIVKVAQRLEGIPLATELAAAQVRVLSVPQIEARLSGLRLLPGGRRTAERHQTLHAVMEWSYNLLSDRERILLARLSVFAGGFTLEAAEGICAGGPVAEEHTLDLLTRLVDKSLVIVDQRIAETRYRLLDTVRQYGREKLEGAGEATALQNRHRDWYLARAEQAEPMIRISMGEWLDRLEVEHNNLRSVLEWCEHIDDWAAALKLAAALRRFWLIRGYWTEGRRWLDDALAKTPTAPVALRAKAIEGAATLAQHQGDYDRALALSDDSLTMYRTLADNRGIADSLRIQGNVLLERGDFASARQVHEESLRFAREAEDKWAIAVALVNLSAAVLHEGQFERARTLCREGLALCRDIGDQRGAAFALNLLGMIAHDQGDFVAARQLFGEALEIQRTVGERRGIATSLTDLGLAALELGDYDEAMTLYEQALTITRELGDKARIARLLYYQGQVAVQRGDNATAASLFGECLVMRRAAGNRAGIAHTLEALAQTARGQPARAAKLLGAATALRQSLGEILSLPEQTAHDRELKELHAALGEELFGAAWEEGRAMTLDQAVEYALAFSPYASDPPVLPGT